MTMVSKTKSTTKKAQTLAASVANKKDTNRGDTTPEGDKKPAAKPTVAKLKDPPQTQKTEADKENLKKEAIAQARATYAEATIGRDENVAKMIAAKEHIKTLETDEQKEGEKLADEEEVPPGITPPVLPKLEDVKTRS